MVHPGARISSGCICVPTTTFRLKGTHDRVFVGRIDFGGRLDHRFRSRRSARRILDADDPGLAYGSIYALVAVGYTLVYGVLRLINFAHSEVFMIGMFGQYLGLMLLGFRPQGDV